MNKVSHLFNVKPFNVKPTSLLPAAASQLQEICKMRLDLYTVWRNLINPLDKANC